MSVVSLHSLRSQIERTKNRIVENVPARPSVICRLSLGDNGILAIVGTHLEAYNTRFRQRRQQLRDIYRAVRLVDGSKAGKEKEEEEEEGFEGCSFVVADQALVLGDFNLHQEAESVVIEPPYGN